MRVLKKEKRENRGWKILATVYLQNFVSNVTHTPNFIPTEALVWMCQEILDLVGRISWPYQNVMVIVKSEDHSKQRYCFASKDENKKFGTLYEARGM